MVKKCQKPSRKPAAKLIKIPGSHDDRGGGDRNEGFSRHFFFGKGPKSCQKVEKNTIFDEKCFGFTRGFGTFLRFWSLNSSPFLIKNPGSHDETGGATDTRGFLVTFFSERVKKLDKSRQKVSKSGQKT